MKGNLKISLHIYLVKPYLLNKWWPFIWSQACYIRTVRTQCFKCCLYPRELAKCYSLKPLALITLIRRIWNSPSQSRWVIPVTYRDICPLPISVDEVTDRTKSSRSMACHVAITLENERIPSLGVLLVKEIPSLGGMLGHGALDRYREINVTFNQISSRWVYQSNQFA